ncbi:MAG: alpha/beta hydrolase [Clostridia bacterium]|nr:alpha/beta hydrolase [Clostridia bacterium]
MKSNDGLLLAGRLFRCNNSNKMVILFHGYRSIAENDFSPYFRWYYEHDYNILLVDQRAHGKSEGRYITFGTKERYDVVTWCEYVSQNFSWVDEIILSGISMGATTVLLASNLNLPKKVKGIIVDSSFTSPRDIISKVASSKYGIDIDVFLPFLNLFCMMKAKCNIYECSVIDSMKENELPILFIHGLSDDFVPSKMTKANYAACHTRKQLVLVDCVTHGFACVYDKEKVQSAMESFLKSLA